MSSFAEHGAVCVTFRTSIPCDLAQVSGARIELRTFLEGQSVGEQEIAACELALAEACNNAIQNVTPAGQHEPVEIVAICSPGHVELYVNDHTPGFDWPDSTEAPEWQEEHGRGLFFIQAFMDHARYVRGATRNSLVMRKKRGALAQSPDSRKLQQRLVETEQALSEMARELCFRSETLAAICRCSADLGRSNDLKGFAERLMNDLLHIAAAEWFIVRTLQGENRLVVFVTSPLPQPLSDLALHSDPEPPSVEIAATRSSQTLAFGAENPLATNDPLPFATGAGLVHPIRMDGVLVGTLAIGRSSSEEAFSVAQREVIRTFADFLGNQVLHARLRDEQIASHLLSHEVEIARGIQQSLLPKTLPRLPGFGISAFCQSARQVGGDFYDVLQLSNDSLLLVIADVMGKGVPAAMFAALLRSLIRANPDSVLRPDRVLSRINRLLFDDLSNVNMFITAQLVLLDLARRQISLASAGHCPLLVSPGTDNPTLEISAEGMPLGIMRDARYEEITMELPPKARLLLYTDGVTECRGAEGHLFGLPRLQEWLGARATRDKKSETLKEELVATLLQFEGSSGCSDDRTFIIAAEEPGEAVL